MFFNGQILYRGRSAQCFRDPGFLGIVNPENDAVYLPLKKGSNELMLAVSELAADGDSFAAWQAREIEVARVISNVTPIVVVPRPWTSVKISVSRGNFDNLSGIIGGSRLLLVS